MARITEGLRHPAGEIVDEDLRKVSESDWLSNLIATSKLVVTTGDVIAVPHVRWAASAVLFFLESIQQIKQNKSRYQELAENIVTFLSILSNKTSSEDEGELLLKYIAICSTFRTRVLRISRDLEKSDQSHLLQRFWRKDGDSDLITRSAKTLDNVKLDLLVNLAIDEETYLDEVYRTILGSQNLGACFAWSKPKPEDFPNISPGHVELLQYSSRLGGTANTVLDALVRVDRTTRVARLYRGQNSLNLFKKDFRLHSYVRHPYVLQLFGVSGSARHPALFFHEELYSLDEFEMDYVNTLDPVNNVIFHYQLMQDYKAAHKYLTGHFKNCLYDQFTRGSDFYYWGCSCGHKHFHTYRCETLVNAYGHACITFSPDIPAESRLMRNGVNIDIGPPSFKGQGMVHAVRTLGRSIQLNDADLKVCLSTFHGHVLRLCYRSANFRARLEVPTGDVCDTWHNYSGPAACAAKFQLDPRCFVAGRITFTPNIPTRVWDDYPVWYHCMGRKPAALNLGEWTRYTITPAIGNETDIFAISSIYEVTDIDSSAEPWIVQAAYVRSKLCPYMVSPNPGMILTTHVECAISAPPTYYARPPFSHFQLDEEGIAKQPRTYWSFNPLGGKIVEGGFVVDEMSSAEMDVLELTPPLIMMRSWGATWDRAHYDAVRQFHWLCGFDPDSCDVAEFLGLPIVQVHPVRSRIKRRRSTPFRIETIPEIGEDYYASFYDGQPVFEPNVMTGFKRARRKSSSEYVEVKGESDPVYPYEHSA